MNFSLLLIHIIPCYREMDWLCALSSQETFLQVLQSRTCQSHAVCTCARNVHHQWQDQAITPLKKKKNKQKTKNTNKKQNKTKKCAKRACIGWPLLFEEILHHTEKLYIAGIYIRPNPNRMSDMCDQIQQNDVHHVERPNSWGGGCGRIFQEIGENRSQKRKNNKNLSVALINFNE